MFRRYKRAWAWLAIIALLSNALATFSLAPLPGAALVDDVLGPLVICTADGAKENPGHGGSGRHGPSDHCPACVTVKPFVLVVAVIPTSVDFPLSPASRPSRLQSRSPAIHVSLGGIRSRAPPLFA